MTTTVLPSLPTGWGSSRLRFLATINPSKGEVSHLDPTTEVSFLPMEAVGEDASLDTSRTRPVSEVITGYTYFRDRDILIAKITPCFENGKATLARDLVHGVGFGSTEFHVIRPGRKLETRFAFYVTRSSLFRDFGTASMYGAGGQKRVPTEFVADFPVPLPPITHQKEIADFLDREAGKIDALVAKQEQLIAAFEEHWQSAISRAVSRGLSEADSTEEHEWLGHVPSHWRVTRASRVLRIFSGYAFSSAGFTRENLEAPILITPGSFTERGTLRPEADGVRFEGDFPSEFKLAAGDLVVVMTDLSYRKLLLGRAAFVERADVLLNQRIGKIILNGPNEIDLRFLRYVFNAPCFREQILSSARGATVFHSSPEKIRSCWMAVPPLSEQQEIATYLEEVEADIHRAISACRASIRLLNERRAALITAAVTGQIAIDIAAAPERKPTVGANDNRQAVRAVVGAEIVARHGAAKTFGRVKLQKLLYLAEVHAGVHELAGNYVREAAGPLARDLLSDTEKGMAAAGFYSTVPPLNDLDGYTYARIGNAGTHRDQFAALLGVRATALTSLIDLLRDYDKRAVEAITTLYAVWNDALLDGEPPDEDRIIRGVLEEWHPEKKGKFTAADLKRWLAWMNRNGLVPTGTGLRTQLDRLFV